MAISDEALMLKYAKGDIDAFEQLLERHRGPLFGYLCRILKNRELAEDTFQEVFVRRQPVKTKFPANPAHTCQLPVFRCNKGAIAWIRRSGVLLLIDHASW